MKGKLIWSVFWALVGVFVILVSMIFIPRVMRLPTVWWLTLLPAGVVFVLLSVALLFLTVKAKVGGIPKLFLLLAGASGVGLPVSTFLHNAVSGLFNIEEPVFFIIAILVCPIGFLVGAVGTIVLTIKRKQVRQ